MTRTHDMRGGVVAEVLVSILAVLCVAATFALAPVAIERFRSEGDRVRLAVVLVPAVPAVVLSAISILLAVQRRREKAIAVRRALNPDEPWLWTDQWRTGRIHDTSSWGATAIVVAFAAIWNAALTGGGLIVFTSGDPWRRPALVAFLLVFALAGLALIASAVYMILLARKYPPSVFVMGSVPGVLGGHLGGLIQMPERVRAGAEARVQLACERASSGSTGPHSHTLWQDEVTLAIPPGGSLPVAFTIPSGLPPSELPERAGTYNASPIAWSLSVTVRVPGVDYLATFVVPVFAVKA